MQNFHSKSLSFQSRERKKLGRILCGGSGSHRCNDNISWMHNKAWTNGRDRISSKWYSGKGTTDVTQFADAYCTMSGCR